MKRIEKIREVWYDTEGVAYAVFDGQVSDASDLPAKNANFCGVKVQAGSIMQIVQADEPTYVTLDADGTWYPEQS